MGAAQHSEAGHARNARLASLPGSAQLSMCYHASLPICKLTYCLLVHPLSSDGALYMLAWDGASATSSSIRWLRNGVWATNGDASGAKRHLLAMADCCFACRMLAAVERCMMWLPFRPGRDLIVQAPICPSCVRRGPAGGRLEGGLRCDDRPQRAAVRPDSGLCGELTRRTARSTGCSMRPCTEA